MVHMEKGMGYFKSGYNLRGVPKSGKYCNYNKLTTLTVTIMSCVSGRIGFNGHGNIVVLKLKICNNHCLYFPRLD